VRTDVEKARQILLNLLSNSVKLTHAGGRIDCVRDERWRTFARGIRASGAHPRCSSRCPSPLCRCGGSTRRRTKAPCVDSRQPRPARTVHGDLEAEGTPGNSSTFTFAIPLAKA
jgi:light-regulated signal transduction histidine kinase (bacteriophytochrome)